MFGSMLMSLLKVLLATGNERYQTITGFVPYSIADNGHIWVAVGYPSNVCQYSFDRVSWTQGTMPVGDLTSNGRWFSVAWNGTTFCAVGTCGTTSDSAPQLAATSPDGINWTIQTIGGGQWTALVWYPPSNLFVTCGYRYSGGGGGTISTSPNGVNWTSRTIPEPASSTQPSLYTNGTSIIGICQLGTRLWTSSTGVSWAASASTLGSTANFAWNGSIFCGISPGAIGTNTTMTSSDGLAWTAHPYPSTTNTQRYIAARLGGGFIVMEGASMTYYYTIDGINWIPGVVIGTDPDWTAMHGNLDYWLGMTSGYPSNANPYSWVLLDVPKGLSYTPYTMGGSPTLAYMFAVTVNSSGLFVAVGGNTSNVPLIAHSADGITWTVPYAMNGATDGKMFGVTVNSSGLFVAVGYSMTTAYPLYATSSDGSTWTTPALMNGSNVNVCWALLSGGMSGNVALSNGNLTATSLDGNGIFVESSISKTSGKWYCELTATGIDVSIGNGSGSFLHISAATNVGIALNVDAGTLQVYSNGVLSGTKSFTPNSISYVVGSIDFQLGSITANFGASAFAYTVPSGYNAGMNVSSTIANMYAVTVNASGLFVAVGYNNGGFPVYATSSNGSTWTTPAVMNGTATPTMMLGVTVNAAGLFVAVGKASNSSSRTPQYATSTDGSTWTNPTSMSASLPTTLTSVAVNAAGLFVAVGYDYYGAAVFFTSSNGSNWSASTHGFMGGGAGAPGLMTSIAISSTGVFEAVGEANNTGGSPIYASSVNGTVWTQPVPMGGTTTGALMNGVAVNAAGLFVAVGYLAVGSYPVSSHS